MENKNLEISKIKIEDSSYEIKDEEFREAIKILFANAPKNESSEKKA